MDAWSYLVGLLTIPTLIVVGSVFVMATEKGKEIECRACGYSTGSMDTTRRATCWFRWRWHKLTTGHHTRRWQRRHA